MRIFVFQIPTNWQCLCAGDIRGNMEGKITMLSRSNFTVFEDAAKLAGRERQIKIHIIGVRENCQHILHIPKPVSTCSNSNTLKIAVVDLLSVSSSCVCMSAEIHVMRTFECCTFQKPQKSRSSSRSETQGAVI